MRGPRHRHLPGDRPLRRRSLRARGRRGPARPGARRRRARRRRPDPGPRRDHRRAGQPGAVRRPGAGRDARAARVRDRPADPAGPPDRRPDHRRVRRGAAARRQGAARPPGVPGDVPRRHPQRLAAPVRRGVLRRGAVHPAVGLRGRRRAVPVHWWHGDSDHIIPHAHGEHLAARLPHAVFSTIAGESHLGGLGRGHRGAHRADGARAAARPALRSPPHNRHSRHADWTSRGVRWHAARTSVTMGSQVHTLHIRSTRSRPGTARLHSRDRWGRRISTPEHKEDRRDCSSDPFSDPWSSVRPLGAVRAVPAHRVGRGRRARRRPAGGVDAAACPGRHLPHGVLLERRLRHRRGDHLGPARLEPPALRGDRGARPPAPRARATPPPRRWASSTPSPGCTAT